MLRGKMLRKSLDLRSWDAAQRLVREWETDGVAETAIEVSKAVEAFMKDCTARNLARGSIKLYRIVLQDGLVPWALRKHIHFVGQFDVDNLRAFRASWKIAPITANDRLKKLRAFFRFAIESGWIEQNPALSLKPAKLVPNVTLPFDADEMARILQACDEYKDHLGRVGTVNGRRVKAFVLLLRYAGLRIGDGVALPVKSLHGERLFLRTEKTGTAVYAPLPRVVVDALDSFPHGDYFFWTGVGDLAGAKRAWDRRLKAVFVAARIPDGHAHRLRDTFAVDLLEKGVPIEVVATLLGNTVAIVEKHYAPWVASRQVALEAAVHKIWAPEPASASKA